jgi:hypothetical protein
VFLGNDSKTSVQTRQGGIAVCAEIGFRECHAGIIGRTIVEKGVETLVRVRFY